MYSSAEEIQEFIKELESNQIEIRKNLAEMVVHISNVNFTELWNMSILDRNMILNRHNKNIEQQKGA